MDIALIKIPDDDILKVIARHELVHDHAKARGAADGVLEVGLRAHALDQPGEGDHEADVDEDELHLLDGSVGLDGHDTGGPVGVEDEGEEEDVEVEDAERHAVVVHRNERALGLAGDRVHRWVPDSSRVRDLGKAAHLPLDSHNESRRAGGLGRTGHFIAGSVEAHVVRLRYGVASGSASGSCENSTALRRHSTRA